MRLYANDYTREKSMGVWLAEMEKFRRDLQHYNQGIPDEEFARILLGCVMKTHREVVRQYSQLLFNTLGGNGPPRVSFDQVMNALRSDDDMDLRAGSVAPAAAIASQTKLGKGRKNKQRGQKQVNAGKQQNQNNQQAQKKEQGTKRKCYVCGDPGHIAATCPKRVGADESESVSLEKRRWQNRKKVNNEENAELFALCVAPQLSTVQASDWVIEWILDSGSDVHVCCDRNLLSSIQEDPVTQIEAWNGSVSSRILHVDVKLLMPNVSDDGQAQIQLPNVYYTETGH